MRWRKDHPPKSTPDRAAERDSVLQAITRFWVTLLIIAVILYATLLVVGRLAGFKDLVQNALEPLIGLPVKLDEVRVRPDLSLAIKGLHDDQDQLRVEMARAHVRWVGLMRGASWPFRSLDIDGATIRFSQAAEGRWQPMPALAGALLPWMKPDGQHIEQAELWESIRVADTKLDVRNVSLTWVSGATNLVNEIDGLSLTTAMVKPFSDDILWSKLHITAARAEGIEWLRDLHVEWLRMPGQDVVLKVSQPAGSP